MQAAARAAGLVEIPPGSFVMGSARHPERFARVPMRITRAFHLAPLLVTQREWRQVMGTTPWRDATKDYERMLARLPFDDELPAINLCQLDVLEFCRRASAARGLALTPPPEVHWEYACRAGSTTECHWGDDEYNGAPFEWVDWGEEAPAVHPPGKLKPNAFGLYDMAGNVHEFVRDRYAATPSHKIAATLYTSPDDFVSLEGEFTVTRSAAVLDSPPALLSAAKTIAHPTRRKILAGFRLAHVVGVTA